MEDPAVGLFARRSARLDRWVQFGMAGGRVIKVDFLVDRPTGAEEDHPLLDRFERYLERSEAVEFDDVEIALTGPTDHRPVYETLRGVPHGTEVEVHELVERTAQLPNDEDGQRTAREAIAANPVPVIVPDHRVRDVTGASGQDVRDALRDIEGLG